MDLVRKIFLNGVEAVHPRYLIRSQITRVESTIILNKDRKQDVDLNNFGSVYVVGFGKAVLPMAEELVGLIGNKLRSCVLSLPVNSRPSQDPRIEIHRGAKSNIPDADSFRAAKRIVQVISSCAENDLLLLLISGGGSALLPYPKPPITLVEKSDLVKQLSRNGVDIREMNIVRKKISMVKGGGLLKMCRANKIVSLILSDVLGDDLDIIASGPTAIQKPSEDMPTALQIVKKYIRPFSVLSPTVQTILQETEEPGEVTVSQVTNLIIGNNTIALNAAAEVVAAETDDCYIPLILTSVLEGEARIIGQKIAKLSYLIATALRTEQINSNLKSGIEEIVGELKLPDAALQVLYSGISTANEKESNGICLLFGGETTVKVTGTGVGGRNQELALSAALMLHHLEESGQSFQVTICSGGTDGIDGPCDAAGAIVTSETIQLAINNGLSPHAFLDNNDSYNFFKIVGNGQFHLITGLTETNVMDMVIVIIKHPKLKSQAHNIPWSNL